MSYFEQYEEEYLKAMEKLLEMKAIPRFTYEPISPENAAIRGAIEDALLRLGIPPEIHYRVIKSMMTLVVSYVSTFFRRHELDLIEDNGEEAIACVLVEVFRAIGMEVTIEELLQADIIEVG